MPGREYPAIWPGTIEIRQRGRTLRGTFPYRSTATVRDRGRVRKERFGRRAFRYTVSGAGEVEEVNLLAGHAFDSPLASRSAGTLTLREDEEALTFEATLPPANRQPTWMRDSVLAVQGGLYTGISPGFRVPPADVVPDAEELIPEPGNPDVLIRVINAAVLYELSLVTRPAYPDTALDIRAWEGLASDGGVGETDERGPGPGPSGVDRRELEAWAWL